MIDIKELRKDKRPQSSIVVHALLDRLEAAESECLEQARLNGMGSEREAALMAKLEAAEKDIAVKEEVIDSLAAVVKRLDAQCDAAERERDECNRRRLEAADHFAAQTALMKQKYDDLRAKITEMEKQEPVAWRTFDGEGGYDYRSYEDNENYKLGWDARNPNHIGWVEPLYALPGAQPAPSHALDDNATIAGLESEVTHLSVLLDSFRALLVEVNDVCGRDGHGGQLEDGESEIIDKVRAAISMTEAPPCAKGEEK